MKHAVLALAATIGLALPAWADSPAPAAPAAAAATPEPAKPMDAKPTDAKPTDAKSAVKAIREACRAEANEQGLKGPDKMKAVSDCVVKQRPDLAQREQCRMDGRGKGLRKDDLKSFVKDCVKGKG